MDNPALRVRVSLPHGHFTVPAVTAERGGWRVLEDTPKRKKRTPKPRVKIGAATPTPTEPETVSGDTPEE